MPESTSPAPGARPWARRWLVLSIKTSCAVAALTALAQWGSPLLGNRMGPVASRDIVDPPVTGSLRAQPRLPAPPAAGLDQRGLLTLLSRSQADETRSVAPRKR